MSKKSQFNTFCRISDFLEVDDAEYLEFLKGTCVISQLSSKGKEGRTLLIYKDNSVRKKIQDLIYSLDPAEVKKGRDMLAAAIFRDVYRSASDWKNKPAINSLFPSQQVDIDPSTAGKEVKFKSGAVATLADKFIDSSPKNNLAVWYITKGEIPVTTDRAAKMPPKGAKKGSYAGGYMPTGANDSIALRAQIVTILEKEFETVVEKKQIGKLFGKASIVGGGYDNFKPLNKVLRDPFLEAMLSLASFTKKSHNNLYFEWILPHVSFNKIDIYLMIQPYMESRHVIPDEVIREWLNSNPEVNFQKVIDQIDVDLSTHKDGTKFYSDRLGMMQRVDEQRRNFKELFDNNNNAAASIKQLYDEFDIVDFVVSPLFPTLYRDFYSDHKDLRLASDELRYVTNIMFNSVKEKRELSNIYLRIYNVLSTTGDYFSKSLLLNNNKIRSWNTLENVYAFIYSTYFIFVPLTCKEMKSLPFKNVTTRTVGTSKLVQNMHKEAVELATAAAGILGQGEGDIIMDLNGVDSSSDEALKEAIIAAYNRIK